MAKAQIKPGGEAHYESARQKRTRPKAKLQAPLTPMIDVTFQLLIFFLLTAQFRDELAVPGSIPRKGVFTGPPRPDVMEVYVLVRQQGNGKDSLPIYGIMRRAGTAQMIDVPTNQSVAAYRQQAAQRLYEELLEAKRGSPPDAPAIIRPEVDYERIAFGGAQYVRWQYVAEAYTQAMRCEFKEIGFQWQMDVMDEGS